MIEEEKPTTLSRREQILNLKNQGLGPAEISRKLKIPLHTVYYHYYQQRERQREYESRPEFRERKREYRRRPEVRERQREYMREYMQRPEVRERQRQRMLLLDAFTDFETGHTIEDLRKVVGGMPSRLKRDTELYVQLDVLKMTVENGVEFYRLNPSSPYHKIAGGYFKEKERKLFNKKY